MDARPPEARIGTSGYQYDHWKHIFYPPGLPKSGRFAYYARHFTTVEINNTFYRLPEASTFDAWRLQAPPGFCYALKFSRYATHLKHLKDPHEPIERFVARAQHLQPLLGPVVVQLPPRWNVDVPRLAAFLEALPGGIRWSLEFRDTRWLCDEVYALLEQHRAALCLHDLIPDHPQCLTTDWVYLRFHGPGGYPPQSLMDAACRIRSYLAQGKEVYAYFNNDAHGHALRNAVDLKRCLATDAPCTHGIPENPPPRA